MIIVTLLLRWKCHEDYCHNKKVAQTKEILLTTMRGQDPSLLSRQRQCPEAYCPCNKKFAQIKEIMLTTTRRQDPLLLLWQRQEYHKSDVTRFIALKTTKSREIMLPTPMSRDSVRLRSRRQSCRTVLETPMSQDLERSCSRGRCCKTIVATTRS